ncbi:Na/Pi cotransporter family protein [Plastorhodobacter daqingensis]|uniref:Na/Pi cotransporter family protein n=1 Tax=Plastorhodobacter daqingensis TaxID=1387281 RepID=A0ABW2UKU7_9RHOB
MESPSLVPFLLHVAGAAALLIWAVRLVRTGVERAFAVQLRRWLRHSARRPIIAAGSGVVVALLLQSSTAVAMLAANFTAAGTLAAPVALAILLGADVGSALVVQILMLRSDWLVPLLLLGGVSLFLRGRAKMTRQGGRILIGIALIFVSLAMIRDATEPLRDSAGLMTAMRYLGGDVVTAFLIGAVFAWAVHSSVAAVLLCVTFAAQGLMPVTVAAAMVLGANLGGSVIAWMLTVGAATEARRVILGNLLLRGGGAVLALAGLGLILPLLEQLGAAPARQLVNLHLAFNLAVAAIGLPLRGPLLAALGHLLREPEAPVTLERQSALDPAALARPEQALACAAREILHMGEEVEVMLRHVHRLYRQWDDGIAAAIREKEQAVDRMHFQTKLYLARLTRDARDEEIAQRALHLADMAAHLEAAGDAVSRVMLGLAQRLATENLAFSEAGRQELEDFHDRVLSNAQAALSVLMTLNPDAARALVEEKERVREVEQALQRSHLERLREGRHESIETSNIHQETLRALKLTNTSFTMVAYPILAETGDLLASRLSSSAR